MLTYLHITGLNKIPDVCELCEEYTSKALDYIKEDKTQNEIIGILHNTCNQLRSFEQKVGHLLDLFGYGLDSVNVLICFEDQL